VIWFNAGGCLRCTYSYLIAAYELISSRLIGGSDQFVSWSEHVCFMSVYVLYVFY